MNAPTLIRPVNNATFWPDEIIAFEWDTEPAGPAPLKLDLYLGRNAQRPYEDPGVVVKRWLLRPGTAWTRFNETAEQLGLQPRETYYWQVAREKPGAGMSLLSAVRRFNLRGQRLQGRLQLGGRWPAQIARATPVRCSIGLTNVSGDPLRLYFPTPQHFHVGIRRLALLGTNEAVWSSPPAAIQRLDVVEIAAGQTFQEDVVWPQVDARGRAVDAGEYLLHIRCTANDFAAETGGGFSIF